MSSCRFITFTHLQYGILRIVITCIKQGKTPTYKILYLYMTQWLWSSDKVLKYIWCKVTILTAKKFQWECGSYKAISYTLTVCFAQPQLDNHQNAYMYKSKSKKKTNSKLSIPKMGHNTITCLYNQNIWIFIIHIFTCVAEIQ